MDFIALFQDFKESKLYGRFLSQNHIQPLLGELTPHFIVDVLGYSVQGRVINTVKIGTGKTKIFMWSQMHGNESTTTKSLFDLFNFLKSDDKEAVRIKQDFTLLCIPMLNPDGAEVYTRVNANEVDLNRDSVLLSQPESKLLRETFESFKPDFCYNLHDQRSIFAAGDTKNPATVSFLAPSYNEERDINAVRSKAIDIIVKMNYELQKHIPNQVGRFDDSFNINCIGDMFQSLGVPTVLFEAGHFQEDYEREETRKYIFIAILSSLFPVGENLPADQKINDYLNIPQNKPIFYDFVYRKFRIICNSLNIITTFAAHYKESLVDNKIVFEAFFTEIGEGITNVGHIEYDGEGGLYSDESNNIPIIGQKADFYLNKNTKFVNGLMKM